MEPEKKPEAPTPKPFHPNDYEIGTVVRTRTQGAFKISGSKAWGRFLAKVPDPEGTSIPKKTISNFVLNPDFPKIPTELWSRYVSLCFYMCPASAKRLSKTDHDSQLEVQVCLLRDQATLTKWKMVVPKQVVTGTHVEADLRQSVDLETGEEYTMFPPMGWLHAGTSHSHNTMSAFFSSTDDTSELSVPGLHIVVGSIDHKKMEYEYIASIVLQKNRKSVDLFEVVNTEPVPDVPFHDKVLDYISIVVETNKNRYKGASSSYVGGSNYVEGSGYGRSSWLTDHSGFSAEPMKVEDDDGKLNGFFRFLDRSNSDLFDDVPPEINISSLPDNIRKSLAKEEAFDELLFRLDEEETEVNEQILRDIADLEKS